MTETDLSHAQKEAAAYATGALPFAECLHDEQGGSE
jgi:hypothetical protein